MKQLEKIKKMFHLLRTVELKRKMTLHPSIQLFCDFSGSIIDGDGNTWHFHTLDNAIQTLNEILEGKI